MRYLGSKERILFHIDKYISNKTKSYSNKTFADLFCGTASVAKYFKKYNLKLITNDYMSFSYAFQIAYIKNNYLPKFQLLLNKYNFYDYFGILNYLNSISDKKGFFYQEYTIEGTQKNEFQRNYFSGENAIRIDSIRLKIGEWLSDRLINENEYYILLTSLIDAVSKVSNISGTYGAFLKKDDGRKFNKLKLEPISITNNNNINDCNCEDIFKLIDKVKGDILYLDPPYNSRQYPPYYHILETVTLYDYPLIYGKTGRRPYSDKISPFCNKNRAGEALNLIIKKANFEHIFLSYSTDGLIQINDIINYMNSVGYPEVFEFPQRRFKSNSNGNCKNSLKELLIYVKK